MKQRIRPLLLLKKKTAVFQRVQQNLWALPNRIQSTTPPEASALLSEDGIPLLTEGGQPLEVE